MDLEEVILIDSDDEASLFCSLVDEYPFPPKTPFFNSKKKEVIIVENFDVFNKRVVPVLFRKDSPTTPLTKKEVDILWKELINGEYESPDGLDGNSYSKIKNRYDYEFRGMKNTLSRGFMDIDFMKVIEERNPKIDAIMSAKRKQQIEYEIKILDLHNKYLKGSKLTIEMVTKTKLKIEEKHEVPSARSILIDEASTRTESLRDAKREVSQLEKEVIQNRKRAQSTYTDDDASTKEARLQDDKKLVENLNYKDKYYETLDLLSYKEDENEQLIKKIKQLETLIFTPLKI